MRTICSGGCWRTDPRAAGFIPAGPAHVRVATLREKPNALDQLAEELERRQREPHLVFGPLFLIVYGLHRFRDLRKAEDDFGFGRRGEEKVVSPAERFGELVKEG